MRIVSLLVTLTIAALITANSLRHRGDLAKASSAFPGAPPAVAAKIAAATHSTGPAAAGAQKSSAPSAAAAADTVHQEIDAQLKALKVTSILPGDPGLVIIDKQSYAEGDDLPLAKGRKLHVDKVQEDGVLLTGNGQTFHLDAPAAPDLAAIRKQAR